MADQKTHNRKHANKPGLAARLVATTLLTRVIDDGRNLDALCDRQHGLREYLALEQNDQGLARAIAISALRNRTLIEAILKQLFERPPPKRARFLIHSMHVAATQILILNIPDRAAVDLAVTAIGDDKRTSRFKSMANAVLRRMVREKEELLSKDFSSISAFPKWFGSRLRTDYGKENARRISEIVTTRPAVDLTVKSGPQKWADLLSGIVLPNGSVRLTAQQPIHELAGYEDGEWWVQDAAATLPARLLKANRGDKVLELCAAPGGKTAQLVHAGYDVSALDISQARLNRLAENLERLKFRAKLIEADILEWEPDQLYDAILLDAPCSSTGTIRRHPDVLWTRGAEEVTALAKLQFELLKRSADFLKPGGILVFSNCSMLKEEGEDLLASANKNIECLVGDEISAEELPEMEYLINGQGALRSLPFHMQLDAHSNLGGMDGFFACRFKKA